MAEIDPDPTVMAGPNEVVGRPRRRRVLVVVGLVLALVAAAVVAVPRLTGSDAGVPLTVVGMVTFDVPVGGADVRIVDDRGRELATAATDESGMFEVDVADLSEVFRVDVSGGETDGRVSPVELTAVVERDDVKRDDEQTDPGRLGVDVHLGSTLIATYLDTHGGSLSDAETALQAHLGLDDATDLGRNLHRNPMLAAETFLAAAEHGLDTKITDTVTAMAAGDTATYPPAQANTVINGCDLAASPVHCQGADLAGADLFSAKLNSANLYQSDLTGANLVYANMTDAWLSETNLTDARLTHADLRRAYLGVANLASADLSYAKLNGARLPHAKLTRAGLTNANLNGADLTNASLTDADLTYANLTDADLFHANLTDADLPHADLHRAYLYFADLSGADLIYAKLNGADLSYAKLDGTNLDMVDLTGADLTGVDLREVRFCRTTMPDGSVNNSGC